MKLRFETGQKFLKTSVSRLIFFSKGDSNAIFISVGTTDVASDSLTMWVMMGISSSRHSLSSHDGMGSKSQDFGADC